MNWKIDDNKPIHTQLVDELIRRILNNDYKLGEKMPSVRDLAVQAKVNPNTMQKALVELETRGFIIAKSTSGNFVTNDKNLVTKIKQIMADELTNKFIKTMKNLNFNDEAIINKIRKELEK